ncbi:33106_t:CDS:2 [Gigaspora margarita]|uniref:33106_t:CDS:1 n=1 Tax=Gigaspora margarita TaxID=4874 RepID=A0ABN7UXM2_GIGMA|nr:33106_t:CDS:2 [Gigaspora margarita]
MVTNNKVINIPKGIHRVLLEHSVTAKDAISTFPPRESCNRHVSFESQYGICVICLALLISPRAEIKELDKTLEHIIFVDGAKNE